MPRRDRRHISATPYYNDNRAKARRKYVTAIIIMHRGELFFSKVPRHTRTGP